MSHVDEREVRRDVSEVLVRYATGIDRRDWTLLESCFTDDCVADYGVIGTWHGAKEITDWMRQAHEPCGHTLHRITNVAVTVSNDGVTARCYVDAIVLLADNRNGTRAAGFYDDELVLNDGAWKIANRKFTMVMLQAVNEDELIDLEALL